MTKKNGAHCGYVALLGRTNVGKSTFLNSIMEAKISIVSDKPQTTRKQILGIKTTPKGQVVFFDCPGIHKPYFKLNEKMMRDVQASLADADLLLYFVAMDDLRPDEFVVSFVQNSGKPIILVINKIDKFSKAKVLPMIEQYKDLLPWSEIVPLSAKTGVNIDLIEELIFKYLPKGEPFYPEEESTTQTLKFYASELIREKILNNTHDELPFTTMVHIEEIEDREKVKYIRADIYVETRSQKKIIIGHLGRSIKEIGEAARKDLEEYFERQVYLDLFVKIVPNWRDSEYILSDSAQ